MIETLHQMSAGLAPMLWRSCWQGGLALAAVWLVCRYVQRIPPAVQCWLWRAAYAKLLIGLCWAGAIELPLLAPEAPAVVAADVNDAATPEAVPRPASIPEPVDEVVSAAPAAIIPPASQASATNSASGFSATTWLLVLWLTGVAVGIVRLVGRWRDLRARAAGWSPVDDSRLADRARDCGRRLRLRRRVELLQCDGGGTPFLVGILRPRIVFPSAVLARASDAEFDAVLAHELAHVKRHDLLWNWLAAVVEVLFFFHPVVWLARREWRISREAAADACAVSAGTQDVAAYARSLIELVTKFPGDMPAGQFALGVSETFNELRGRLQAMKSYSALSWSWKTVWMLLIAVAVSAALPWEVTARDADEPTAAATSEPAAETPPAKPARTMRVRIVDPDGRPLEAARMHVSVWTPDKDFRGVQEYASTADGWITVALPQEIDILRLFPSHPGYVPQFAQWWAEKQPDGHLIPDEFTIKMPRGTTIGGVVTDPDGKPVAGARVEVIADFGPEHSQKEMTERPVSSLWLATEEEAVRTDDAGRWRITNMPAGDDQHVRLTFEHPDYIASGFGTRGVKPGEAGLMMSELRGQTATVKLDRGVRVSGTVTDPQGTPVAGAVVIWGTDPYTTHGSQEVRTDDAGRYRLPAMAPGTLPLTVVAQGWAPQMRDLELPNDTETLTADFPLQAGKTVRLRFVDTAGNALPRVGIGISSWRKRQSLYNHKHPSVLDTGIPRSADEDGVFEWSWAPEDAVVYYFGKQGFQPQNDRSFAPGDETHDVVLLREKVIAGTVVDAKTGQPIPRFRVTPAYARNPLFLPRLAPGRPPEWFEEGRYRFVVDEDAPRAFVEIAADGYRPARSDIYALSEGDITFDARLEPVEPE